MSTERNEFTKESVNHLVGRPFNDVHVKSTPTITMDREIRPLFKRKSLYIIFFVLMVFTGYLYYLNQSGKADVQKVVENFYKGFITENYSLVEGLFVNNLPSSTVDLRWRYGEITKYEIINISGFSTNKKKVTVRVSTRYADGEGKPVIDTFLLEKVNEKWIIYMYNNDLGPLGP
ncbi:hypothetical protein J2T17_004334 [Paenibacillus mucilaginosus]|uniref:hypothetical protein n=1 Tax=Paenibacillus mucilaginosus TaxID=61624 RepID=UPI003D1DDC5A